MHDLLIHNCHALILTAEHKPEIRHNQDILINAGTIQTIQPTAPTADNPAHKIIEANAQLAMPGLINTHAHVPMVLFRGLAEDV